MNNKANASKSRAALTVLSLLSVLLCMGAIFFFSSQNGDESADQSLTLMQGFFGFLTKYISLEVFRKAAHFSEFCLLAFLSYNAFYQIRRRLHVLPPFIFSFLYSISDEIHQLFIEDRAFRFFDIFVDTCGILFGLLVFYIIMRIIFKLRRKKM